jgi:hypothetical protein
MFSNGLSTEFQVNSQLIQKALGTHEPIWTQTQTQKH